MSPRFNPDGYSPEKLRELALWYREFAERTENPAIWDARLRTAEDFESAAAHIEESRKPRLVASSPVRDAGTDERLTRRSGPTTSLLPAA